MQACARCGGNRIINFNCKDLGQWKQTRITYFTPGRKRGGRCKICEMGRNGSVFLVSLGQIVLKEVVKTDKIIWKRKEINES